MNKELSAAIICENIGFAYKEKTVFDGLSLSFYKGEHIGIVGESGCGKSTLLKILAGLLTPDYGSISVNGEMEPEKIRKQISMVMQDAMILPLTIYENITLGKKVSQEKLEEIIRATKLEQWINSLPEGIHTYLGNNGNELSGGQAQRIAIARAMVKEADIILLDEPTSALDKATGEEVTEALSKLTEGKTVIAVTHHPDLLKGYDRVLRLEGGRLYE